MNTVCRDQERRLRNINATLQGSSGNPGLISQLNNQRAEQVADRGPFVVNLRTALDEAAQLEFIVKKERQPDIKRGVLAAYAVVIDQLSRNVAPATRITELNSKKAALVTALADLQTDVDAKQTAYNGWNTAAAQALVTSAKNKRLLGVRLTREESRALAYEEAYQGFRASSALQKLSLEAEKLFFEEEISDLSATPPTVTSLGVRNSELDIKKGDLARLRGEIAQHRERIRGFDRRIEDIDRQLLRLTAAGGLTIDPICAQLNPSPAPN
ncbi:hypothetical protein EBR78_09995 [bacterium]|nr:hypothetical protein [bacterium]NBX83804.1 hypothetical protein [bacterium]